MVALALAVAGVEHRAIAEDFAGSAGRLAPRLTKALAAEVDQERRGLMQRRHVTDPETMLVMLAHLEQRYGGASSYLRSYGADDDLLSGLRMRLIESA